MSRALHTTFSRPNPGFEHPRWSRIRFVEAAPNADGTPPAGDVGSKVEDLAPKGGDEALGEGGLKALNSERDARKVAEQKVKELEKQITDSKKSAEELAAENLETEKSGRLAAEARALKYEVAAEQGLELKLASRLSGTTRDELVADAKALKELVGAMPSTPRPDPHQGGGSGASTSGVGAGRDLYAEMHKSKKKD